MTDHTGSARSWLEGLGRQIHDDDFPDLLASADDVAFEIQRTSLSLSMTQVAEPFGEVLKSLAPCALTSDPVSNRKAETGSAGSGRSAIDLVQECLSRIDADPQGQRAWLALDTQDALAAAALLDRRSASNDPRGLLHGLPVGLKDMFDRRGRTATWGSRLHAGVPPAEQDATVVTRLANAGAIVLGTQHMAEFALSPTGFNELHGPGTNPRDPSRVSGGSSSGAGMSVGAGHVPIAIGSDTGGSIRGPAAFCGVSGLKPTLHRVSIAGVMPLSPSMDCIGPLARSAELCGRSYMAIAGHDSRDPSTLNAPVTDCSWLSVDPRTLTVAVPGFDERSPVSPAMRSAFDKVVGLLSDRGINCVSVPPAELEILGKLAVVLMSTEAAAIHRHWLRDHPDLYGPQVRRRLSRGLMLFGIDYYDALRLRRPLLERFLNRTLIGADAALFPTMPDEAPRVSDTVGRSQQALERTFSTLSYWTRAASYLGLPALSLPAGLGPNGLPLGIQFVGPPLGEDRILALGRSLQEISDWHLE